MEVDSITINKGLDSDLLLRCFRGGIKFKRGDIVRMLRLSAPLRPLLSAVIPITSAAAHAAQKNADQHQQRNDSLKSLHLDNRN